MLSELPTQTALEDLSQRGARLGCLFLGRNQQIIGQIDCGPHMFSNITINMALCFASRNLFSTLDASSAEGALALTSLQTIE